MSGPDAENHETLYEVLSRAPKPGYLAGDLNALFTYWETIRGSALAPAWADFDMDAVPPGLIPWFAVVAVSHDPQDFIYCFWGAERTRLQGKDYTGQSVRDFRPLAIAEKAFAEYARVVEERAPIYLSTYGMTDQNEEPFSYHMLRLPFSGDGQAIDHVLGVGLYDAKAARQASKFYGSKKTGSPG